MLLVPRVLGHVCIMISPQVLLWCQVSQHSKIIPGSYFHLPTATMSLFMRRIVSHINMSQKTQTKYMPFLSWSRNTDGYSNVGPQEKAETEALNSCGLNFLLLQILQNLKVLWIHCHIAPPRVLEEPCASGCFSSLSFIIVITDPPWFELGVHGLSDLLVLQILPGLSGKSMDYLTCWL